MTQVLECPNCGAPLDFESEELTIECPYCDTTVIVPDELRPDRGRRPEVAGEASLADTVAAMSDIARLVREGKKIEAVKRYREELGVGLKEAKEAIDRMEAGEFVEVARVTMERRVKTSSPEDIERVKAELYELLGSGRKIEAIKLYREKYNGGLKEAKEAVERLETSGYLETPDFPVTDAVSSALEQVGVIGEVTRLAQEGQKIEAIKLFRQHFDTSLREAKEAVEQLAAGQRIEVTRHASRPGSDRLAVQTAVGASRAAGCLGGGVTLLVAFILLVTVVPILIGMTLPGGPLEEAWMRVNPLARNRVVMAFGDEGSGPGLLADPRSIAVDGEGYIYVASFEDGRVQRFDAQGTFQSLWMLAGDDDEIYVSGMAASRDGRVYVAHDGEIWIYDGRSGELLGQVAYTGENYYFDDVAVTADGGLVAVSRGEDIIRLDSGGRAGFALPEAISSITRDSELDARVAVDGLGNIYALGTFNDAVFKFSPDGRYLTRFGSDGEEPGQFRAPYAISVDGQGRVYVSDINGIQVFDSEGRYLERFGVKGVAFGLTFNDKNELFVVTNTPRVFKYTISRP